MITTPKVRLPCRSRQLPRTGAMSWTANFHTSAGSPLLTPCTVRGRSGWSPPEKGLRSQERHNPAVLGSWDEMIDNVGPRPGMFVGRPRYALVRSFVEGFGAARNDDVLHGFQQWLSSQPHHRAINNFAWPSLLLHEV